MFPTEIVAMIMDRVVNEQDRNFSAVKEEMSRRTRIPKLGYLAQMARWSDNNLNDPNGFFVFVDRLSESNFTNPSEEIWYAVFCKDMAVFVLLCLLQVSFPYWLYHL